MTREQLPKFEGRENVTKITSDNGSISYLTESIAFTDAAYNSQAVKLNTFESEKKHVLFLFNAADAEVARFYLGSKLQGKSPKQIAEMKHQLCVFQSFNPNTKTWVPCVGLAATPSLASTSVAL